MPNNDQPIRLTHLPGSQEDRDLVGDVNTNLAEAAAAERRAEFFTGTVNVGDAFDPEAVVENVQSAAKYRARAAESRRKLAERNFNPEA